MVWVLHVGDHARGVGEGGGDAEIDGRGAGEGGADADVVGEDGAEFEDAIDFDAGVGNGEGEEFFGV